MSVNSLPQPEQRSVTIKDIAVRLNMTHSTVSRALNGQGRISKETRQRVQDMAKELGYVLNLSARLMKKAQSLVIGLIIPDIRNDYYSTIAAVLAKKCRNSGMQMVLGNTEDDPEIEAQQVQAMIESRAAGIMITPTRSPLEKTCALLRQIPLVQLIRHVDSLASPIVCMDDTTAVREATAYLLALGHTRIGYIGTHLELSVGRERFAGFTEAYRAAGLIPDPSLVALVRPAQSIGFENVQRMLNTPHPPTAILFGGSGLTLGGLRAVSRSGLRVPEQLSLVGYGDAPWFELLASSLTAVQPPMEQIADTAVALLFQKIEEQREKKATTATERKMNTLPSSLIMRGSTAPLRPRLLSD